MVSALDRKLLRDLKLLKGQVFTIALVVACGIACYVTMQSTWSSLQNSRVAYYERYRFADVFARLERAPESVAARIADIPGVAQVYTRVVEDVMLPMEGMPDPAMGRLISIPGDQEAPLNGLVLRRGRLPEPGRADEVVVIQTFARAHGLDPGDSIPAVINGSLRQLEVVGVAMSPEYVFAISGTELLPDDRKFAVLWMDRDVLAPAFQMESAFSDVTLKLQPGARVAEVLLAVDDLLEPYGSFGAIGRDKQLSNYFLEGELSQLEQFATVIPAIFLLVAAFLLNVVLSRLVYLQRQQIAALKALGYSNRQIGLHYLKLVSVIVLLGAVVGCALGAYLGDAMTGLYTQYFKFPVLVYGMDVQVAAVGVLVSLAAAFAGALLSVRHIVRMQPAEAMRPPAPARYKPSLLERTRIPQLLGGSAVMVVREVSRRPLRTLLSSLGIAAAIAIVIMGRFMYDSFEYLLEEIYHREQVGDMQVAFIKPVSERTDRVLVHVPGVLDAEGLRTVPVRYRVGHRWRDSSLTGLPERPRLRKLVDRTGSEVQLPDDGIAITRKLGEVLGARVGDDITVEVREGQREVHAVRVAMLVDEAFGMQGYMRLGELRALLGEGAVINFAQLVVDSSAQLETQQRLKEIPVVAGVARKQSFIDRFYQQTGETMGWTTLILTLFAGTIAVGVVYNNARVALSIRSRDLASLRVLGFTRAEISAILLGELAVQIALAIPIGLVLGQAWSVAIASTVDPENYRLPIIIGTDTYAFAIAIAVGAGVASALLVRRKLDKLDLIGVLKTRE